MMSPCTVETDFTLTLPESLIVSSSLSLLVMTTVLLLLGSL